MIYSMTGYGRGVSEGAGKFFQAEVKSINHRYLETGVKQPRKYMVFEEKIKSMVKKYIKRGKVEVLVQIRDTEERPVSVNIDKQLAITYHKAIADLADSAGLSYNSGVLDIIGLPEVLRLEDREEDMDLIWSFLSATVEEALANNCRMREKEGIAMAEDIRSKLESLSESRSRIEERAPQVVIDYRNRLRERITELLEGAQPDPDRIIQEAAFFADKAGIDEELVRLSSHFRQFEKALDSREPVGRKMDFLVQEMNREVNTIGSKANDIGITGLVVEMKSEIEKIREQIQNIQ